MLRTSEMISASYASKLSSADYRACVVADRILRQLVSDVYGAALLGMKSVDRKGFDISAVDAQLSKLLVEQISGELIKLGYSGVSVSVESDSGSQVIVSFSWG